LTEDNCSYKYENGVSPDAPANTFLVYDKSADIHGDGRRVLFLDGHVQWVPESDFQARLAQQRGALPRTRGP